MKTTRAVVKNRGRLVNLTNMGKGRPAGVPNKATGEAKEFFVELVTDPLYRKKFREAFITRKLKPQVEILVWHYAVGRPKLSVETDTADTLADILDRMAAESGL